MTMNIPSVKSASGYPVDCFKHTPRTEDSPGAAYTSMSLKYDGTMDHRIGLGGIVAWGCEILPGISQRYFHQV